MTVEVLEKLLADIETDLTTAKAASDWRWERVVVGKTTWKIGYGKTSKGKLEIVIRERLSDGA